MNIVVYAGDNKYYKALLPIVLEIKKRNHNFLFLYSEETQLKHPHQKEYFSYDGIFPEKAEFVGSSTLGLNLPFKPDVLILARERWQPEQSIIREFKESFNAKVCLVEVSSHLLNNIENRLEMLSRMNYPQNLVDYFFEHSEFTKERRLDCMDESYRDKIVVVGNPRFSGVKLHNNLEKYNIDPNKKQVLFWGVINTTRNVAFDALKVLAEKTKDTHQIFYKCYPGEPTNQRFANQFNPFIVDGVQVVYDENDIFDIASICDIHIGQSSSVFNFAFYFNKSIVNLDSVCNASEHMNDINTYISETGNGIEDSAKFWMNIWKIPTIEEFLTFIDIDRLSKFNDTNFIVINKVMENTIPFDWDMNFLNEPKKEYGDLITLFDEFGFDNNASIRILNFLENEHLR
jgi:hypothetical protein